MLSVTPPPPPPTKYNCLYSKELAQLSDIVISQNAPVPIMGYWLFYMPFPSMRRGIGFKESEQQPD
ncbi:hypothetical protein TREPR_0032 [Treponema primitia ZAS-2]|uniref:Uncharacterized protein n=1 Tax=Treponema primitia (strain ATCC BAA-887 / DSM 12427 / ZAS-2) TaxID=545694 RepID=F5YNX7_TREPZ|nr:hypothetical protein TREPR_0032 [Treponema primitia ZAS-2]